MGRRRARGRGRGRGGGRGARLPANLTLPDDLYDKIVTHMAPSALLTALRLNKLFLRLCTSQDLWRALAEGRWGQSVPPTNDYRRHYVQRSAMEERSKVPDPDDPANWGMTLLVDAVDESGTPVLARCLKLSDATLESSGGGSDHDVLIWKLRTETPQTLLRGGLGACYLWSSDERMCQLTPVFADRDRSRCFVNGVYSDDEDYDNCWRCAQHLEIETSIHLNKIWHLYDGGCAEPAIKACLELALVDDHDDDDHDDDDGGEHGDGKELHLSLFFMDVGVDHVHDLDMVSVRDWPDMFCILPWGMPLPSNPAPGSV